MKKFLFVHDIEGLVGETPHGPGGDAECGRVLDEMLDWKNREAECQSWQEVTVEECNRFEYVMFWLLTEPGNPEKYEKILPGDPRDENREHRVL